MADNKRTYTIEIQGVKHSISEIDALISKLQYLDERLKYVSTLSLNTTSSGGSRASSLSEEDRILKQISETEAKINATRSESYQSLLAEKDLLKEAQNDAKQRAASERLVADAYSDTLKGLKEKLSDIKSVMNTTSLDSDEFKDLVQSANEINSKLKEFENQYGQYARGVGDYANQIKKALSDKSAFDEFKKIQVTVGDTTREFNNVREATRTLSNELKAMVLNGQQDTQQFKELSEAVHKFEMNLRQAESAMNDLKTSSKAMDELLDMAESLTALGQVSRGFSAIFGFDDNEITKSIQKLVALQSTLQGIEKIRQQLNTQEGIGKILAKGNGYIDATIAKLFGVRTAINGVSTSSRAATISVKALSLALKSIGIGFILSGLAVLSELLINGAKSLYNYASGADHLRRSMERLDAETNVLNKTIQYQRELLGSNYMRGLVNDNQFIAKQYEIQNENLSKQLNLLRDRIALNREGMEGLNFNTRVFQDSGEVSWKESTFDALNIYQASLKDIKDAWEKCSEAIKDNEDVLSKYGSGLWNWFKSFLMTVNDTEKVMTNLGQNVLSAFVKELKMTEDFMATQSKAFREGKMSVDEYKTSMEFLRFDINRLYKDMNNDKVLQSVVFNLDKYIPDEKVREKVQSIIDDFVKLNDAINLTTAEQVHHWNQVRIDGMSDGWAKQKAQIDENERYEILQYGKTQEQIELIQKKYNQQRLNARKNFNAAAKSEDDRRRKEIADAEKQLNTLRIANMKDGLDKQLAQLKMEKDEQVKAAKERGIKVNEIILEIEKQYEKKVLDAKREWSYKIQQVYTDMWSKIYAINQQSIERDLDTQLNDLKVQMEEFKKEATNLIPEDLMTYKTQLPSNYTDKGYIEQLRAQYAERIVAAEEYYNELANLSGQYIDNALKVELERLELTYNNELRTLKNSYAQQDKEIEDHYRNGELTLEQYNEIVERLDNERAVNEASILEKYLSDRERMIQERNSEVLQINDTFYTNAVSEYANFFNRLSAEDSAAITSRLGFINVPKTLKRNKELVNAYQDLAQDITAKMAVIKTALEMKDISFETYEQLKNELTTILAQVMKQMQTVSENTGETFEEFVGQVNQYVQAVGQAMNTVIQSLTEINSNRYDDEIEKLQDFIDRYEEELDELADIIQEHSDKVNDIEDELKTARGDRRQALIDQLNAEKIAQRQALAEEKRIQKEKEKAEERQRKLMNEQAKAQHKADVAQAIINAAMAVSMAAVNKWPLPAVPMMALAAAAGAAQIAAVSSAKVPQYADGGVIQGPSHSQGGVKVLGGMAEVEGGEMIINRRTTEVNSDLLYYINSKKHKVGIDELIDFFSTRKAVNKNISNINSKFQSGGVLPSISTDININDRLISAFEAYSNRNIVVSVTDIVDRMDNIRDVQVLAGLNPQF